MSLGPMNPLPFQLGAGPSRTEQLYGALRSAQGMGNDGKSAAGPPGGLRDLWTQCVARAIARRGGTTERAVLQLWPATMTSVLSTWEVLLGLPTAATLPARQAAVQAALTQRLDATIPGLRAALKTIDVQLDIATIPFEQSRTTEPGKTFGGLPGTSAQPFFSGQAAARGIISSQWPLFGDGMIVWVTYVQTIVNAVPPPQVAQAVAALMNTVLPGGVAFRLTTLNPGSGGAGPSGAGFFCDGAHGSRLDWSSIF